MQRAFEKIIEKLKKEKSKHRCDRGEFWCYRDAIEIVNEVANHIPETYYFSKHGTPPFVRFFAFIIAHEMSNK